MDSAKVYSIEMYEETGEALHLSYDFTNRQVALSVFWLFAKYNKQQNKCFRLTINPTMMKDSENYRNTIINDEVDLEYQENDPMVYFTFTLTDDNIENPVLELQFPESLACVLHKLRLASFDDYGTTITFNSLMN